MNIADFLDARIADDEAAARRAQEVMPSITPGWTYWDDALEALQERHAWFAVPLLTKPADLLAECKAKRALIERETLRRYKLPSGVPVPPIGSDSSAAELAVFNAWLAEHGRPVTDTPTLRILAAVYADHRDYDPAWRLTDQGAVT